MKKTRLWFIVCMLVLIAFIGMGVYFPTTSVQTRFEVKRSEASAFKVMTLPANITLLVANAVEAKPIAEPDNKEGSHYQMVVVERSDTSVVDMVLKEVDDLEQFEIELNDGRTTINTVFQLLPTNGGTRIQVDQRIAPHSWWGKSTLAIRKGTYLANQRDVNRRLEDLVNGSPESVLGDWVSVSDSVDTQMLSFRSDGTLDWTVAVGEEVFPLKGLHYKRIFSVQPEYLDISGFKSGPLKGLMLFGILDMSKRDTLRFDAGAGFPDDDRVRPSSFTASTATYVRIR